MTTPTPPLTPTPPALALIELIALNLKGKLDALKAAGTIAESERPAFLGLPASPGDKHVAMYQGDPQPDDGQDQGFVCWTVDFEFYAFARASDKSAAPIDTELTAIESALVYALMADYRTGSPILGGYATNLAILPSERFGYGKGCVGINVKLRVHYRHIEGDMTRQA